MKQQRSYSLSPKVAGLALALFGFGSFMGLTGEVQASQPALSQLSIASADRVGTGDYATRINRGTPERKCPRSNDGCEKPPSCKPGVLVCRVGVGQLMK
jgi:hypothetical protein